MTPDSIDREVAAMMARARSLSADETLDRLHAHVAPNYKLLSHDPVVHADGPWLTTRSGRRLFDGVAAYSAANLGHGHPLVKALLRAFLDAGAPTVLGRFLPDPWLALFAEKLTAMTGFERFLPTNGGVEAPEAAIKLARRWGYRVRGIRGEAEVLFARECFHGRTLTVTQMFDEHDEVARGDFGPFAKGFRRIPYDDLAAVEAAITPNTCAILIEPIQGEGGINIPREGYLAGICAIARRHQVLAIMDEIQTGWARTGTLFRFMHEGEAARPDLLCTGKSLAGGFAPVSGLLGRGELIDLFGPGSHGSTFGGCPISSALGLAALTAIEHEDLCAQARDKGAHVATRLESIARGNARIAEVRGAGMMFGIELTRTGPDGPAYAKRLLELGLVVKDTHHWVLRFTPPITASTAELDHALDALERAFGEAPPAAELELAGALAR